MIEEGMWCARTYDMFLNNTINKKNNIVDGIVEEFSTVFRKTISTNSIKPEEMKVFTERTKGQLLYQIRSVAGMGGWDFVRKDTRSAMNTATKCKYGDATLRNIQAIRYLDDFIWRECNRRVTEIHASYMKSLDMFPLIDFPRLEMFTEKILSEKYQKLNKTDFEKIDVSKYRKMFSDNTSLSTYDMIQSFMDELERHVNEEYGIPLGAFSLSRPYYRLMKTIFPTIIEPSRGRRKSPLYKEEL